MGEAYCRYHRPLRYDDAIVVRTWVTALKRTSIRFMYHIFKQGQHERVAEGYTAHVFVDKNLHPCRIPQTIRDAVKVVDESTLNPL